MFSTIRTVIGVFLVSFILFCSELSCPNSTTVSENPSDTVVVDPDLFFVNRLPSIEITVDDDIPIEVKRINLGDNIYAEFIKQAESPFTSIFNIYESNVYDTVYWTWKRRAIASGSRCGECGDLYSVWRAHFDDNSYFPSFLNHGVVQFSPQTDETAELCRMILNKKDYEEMIEVRQDSSFGKITVGNMEFPDSVRLFFHFIQSPGFWKSDINGGTTALLTTVRRGNFEKGGRLEDFYINGSLAATVLYSPGPIWVCTFNAEGDTVDYRMDFPVVDVQNIIEDFYK